MKIVVTGGAGFIGANLCNRLAQSGRWSSVVAFDDLSTGNRKNLREQDGVDLVEGSILDEAAWAPVGESADAIVHLAARPSVPRSLQDPLASNEVNVTGTLRVLEAARRSEHCHVVVASSSSVYGSNPALPKHEGMAPRPKSPYAVSKLATENYALAYRTSFGLDVLALRFFNVFGPLQPAGHAYAAVIPAFIAAALADQPVPVHGDGTQTRDFTFIGSVVDLLVDALERRVTHDGPVNVAFGTRTSLNEVIDLLSELLARPVEVENLAPRVGDIAHSQADNTLLRQLFPQARPVDLRQGLEETLAWFRESA
jgi:UDP-glucose 4-epimerase